MACLKAHHFKYSMSINLRMFHHQIKETRRALRDSESGLEKMAIGHHIQDRGHVVEKKVNKKTGERELNQNFQNMDECRGIFRVLLPLRNTGPDRFTNYSSMKLQKKFF